MNVLSDTILIILFVMMPRLSSDKLPVNLIGHWSVGTPYRTPGPIGINAEQEEFIRGLHLVYSPDHLRVCGRKVPVQPIKTKSLSNKEFLQIYGFMPHIIGMKSSPITDLSLSASRGMNACGEYEDPGVHLLLDPSGHVVMEVANDYLPLKKESTQQQEAQRVDARGAPERLWPVKKKRIPSLRYGMEMLKGCGMTMAGTHLSDDETVAKVGHPGYSTLRSRTWMA